MIVLLTDLRGIKIWNLFMLTVAGLINAIGITMFLAPVSLYDSGISGTSMFLAQITPEYLTLSIFLIVLNVPLFLYGMKKQGTLFTVYAIYVVMIYSVMAHIINNVLPIDVSSVSPFAGNDLLLCSLFGGVISGAGSGLAIRYGGAMDGIEVMAVIFAKRLGISVGTFVMMYNILLYVIVGAVIQSWILPLYSIVTYMVGSKTVDFIVEGLDRAKCAIIITDNPRPICNALMTTFETGATKVSAVGGYSNTQKTMVYFVLNRFQVAKMRNIVKEIDENAYIIISEVADVFANTSKN